MCLAGRDLVRVSWLSSRYALAVALISGHGWGAEPTAAPGSAAPPAAGAAAAPEATPLVVRIDSASPEVGEAEFLAALFRTFRRPLVAAASDAPAGEAELNIRYDAERRELVV